MWLQRRSGSQSREHFGPLVMAAFLAATILMLWLGFRATREWQRSTVASVEARGNEMLALLAVALEKDMNGGQLEILLPINRPMLDESSLYDLADLFAGGFARFPYVESVFVWKAAGPDEGVTFFFNRADRLPEWDTATEGSDPYPVVVRRNPAAVRHIVALAREQENNRGPLALFETKIGKSPYQVLVHPIYGDGASPVSLVGFTVNQDWVRRYYFHDLVQQLARIGGNDTTRLEVVDEHGQIVSGTGPVIVSPAHLHTRSFPLAFASRSVATASAAHLPAWTARVDVSGDATLLAARRGTVRTLALLALGAIAATGALVLMLQAARSAARLAARQSEFVSAVSHEMKTPLSLITLTSDSLANGRYTSPESIVKYARFLGTEARHLTRLIENVLCYARLLDVQASYSFELVDVVELLNESVERFRIQLAELACEVEFDHPPSMPPVKGDRAMLRDAFENVIDNALKYGADGRHLGVRVHCHGTTVHVDVVDRGAGIPSDEIGRVFDKFHRAKGAKQRGSGLGLAIVRKIVQEHRGRISIDSELGRGTTVRIELPAARAG
jgi:signal transduction histidine kinase